MTGQLVSYGYGGVEPPGLEPVELEPVELEPVELELAELEPVELGPVELGPVELGRLVVLLNGRHRLAARRLQRNDRPSSREDCAGPSHRNTAHSPPNLERVELGPLDLSVPSQQTL